MAFIEKASEILKKSLTQTIEDPENLKRGLELFARGVTLPDADDSTGDLSKSGFALGRFRQEARRRDQEDIEAANKAKQEADARQKLAEMEFKKGELDRKLTADVQLAQLREEGEQQRAEAKLSLDQKMDARRNHALFLSDSKYPTELMFNKKGEYNLYGLELARLGQLTLLPSTVKKLYHAKVRQRELYLRKLNKDATPTANRMKGEIHVGGALAKTLEDMTGIIRPVVSEKQLGLGAPNITGGDSQIIEATQTASETLTYIQEAIRESITNPRNKKEAAAAYGLKIGEFENVQAAYDAGIEKFKTQGMLADNKEIDYVVEKTLIPLIESTNSQERFVTSFRRLLRGVTIEGKGVVNEGYQSDTYDVNFLLQRPFLTRAAVKFVDEVTPELLQAITESAPENPNAVITKSVPIQPEEKAFGKTPEVFNIPKATGKAPKKVQINIEHDRNHYPLEVTKNIRDVYNNIGAIKNEEDRKDIEFALETARKRNDTLDTKTRYDLYNIVFDRMNKNKADFLPTDRELNPYAIYAFSLIDSAATSYTEVQGSKIVNVNLTKVNQRPRYKSVDNKITQDVTDTFKRRERAQAQRLEIRLQLLGMMRLNDMTVSDMRSFGEEDYAAALGKPSMMGTGSELKTGLESFIGTAKDLFRGIFGNATVPLMASQRTSSLNDMESASLYAEGRSGANNNGYTWRMDTGSALGNINTERMLGLKNESRKQHEILFKEFTKQMNNHKKIADGRERADAKRLSYVNYLKRTALLWEKTALTYKLAGYVQGDQTGGRTISNQDFDNVYRALWGGKFFTELGARNALRYLQFKNEEALQRGIGEDLLLQATGETFTSSDNHVNATFDINQQKINRFYNTEDGKAVQKYLQDPESDVNNSAAVNNLRQLDNIRKSQGLKFIGIPLIDDKNNATASRKVSKAIEESHNILTVLSNFRSNMDAKGGVYDPTPEEKDVYSTLVNALRNPEESDLGLFLANNVHNYRTIVLPYEKENRMIVGFPPQLIKLAKLTSEVLLLSGQSEDGVFKMTKNDAKSSRGYNLLQINFNEQQQGKK